VIKIPRIYSWGHFLLGLLANLQERKFSRAEWSELCPVVASIPGGWLVVMKYARPLTEKEWKGMNVDQWMHREDYSIPVEPKINSFGVLNGNIVAIDYGS